MLSAEKDVRFRMHLGIRQLDVDDLYLLQVLGQGSRLVDAASQLGLTQPAITQRVRKIEGALECAIVDKSFRGTRLTGRGRVVCAAAEEVLLSLEQLYQAALINDKNFISE
jgi:DNA-binding transcriptional LysR family regulator